MKGYMNGARTELELNRIKAAISSSTSTSGMSHHFFSSRRKTRNSLHRRHMRHGLYPAGARMAKPLAVLADVAVPGIKHDEEDEEEDKAPPRKIDYSAGRDEPGRP